MMRTPTAAWCAATLAFGAPMAWSAAAIAHVEIVLPESRYGPDLIKDAPCGHPDNPLGAEAPHVYQTGETIVIVIDEFVAHEGHLRIAWAENDEDFVNITAYDDFYNFPGVLMDNIEDGPGLKQYTIELTLPPEECDNCTLQVIQVMYEGGMFDESALYYSCADITLLDVVPGADDDDDGGMDDAADDAGDVTGGGDMGDAAGDGDTEAGESSDGTGGGADGSSDGGGGCSVGATNEVHFGWFALSLALLQLRRRKVA